tara:strand:- start:659 stop:901 length:243 start_codon:yes stop_codon:yes gene_type:complete
MKIYTLEETKNMADENIGTVNSKEAKIGVVTFIYDEMTNSLKRGVIVDIHRSDFCYTVLDIEALKWDKETKQYTFSFTDV